MRRPGRRKRPSSFEEAGEEEEAEFEVLILREIRDEDSSVLYETVTDEDELSAIGKVFAELLDDTEVVF